MTREDFLEAYRKELAPFQAASGKVEQYLAAVSAYLDGALDTAFSPHTVAVWKAWRAAGGDGAPTRKARRALPRRPDRG